ncbi:hypothetical protein [Rummeliibacillus pycnus]|uniref:hypothetical protein n=1 Tax=Rummeliibacillus pycnus TaxID=101070 RepID=UPI0037C6AF5E
MQVTEWYSIRALTMSSSWVALFISFVLMGLLLWILYSKEIASIFSDVALQLILIWKFSVIVTDFSMVIKHPLTILYFNGGMIGFVLGILFICIKLWYKLRQSSFKVEYLQAVFVTSILCSSMYQILMTFLNDAALWQRVLTITSFTCWIMLALWKRKADFTWHKQLLLLFLCTHAFVATLQPLGIWQLSVLVTTMLGLFNLTLISSKFPKTK